MMFIFIALLLATPSYCIDTYSPVCKIMGDSCADPKNTVELNKVPDFDSSSDISEQITYAVRLHCAGLNHVACGRAPMCTPIEEGSCFILWGITANQTYMMAGKMLNTIMAVSSEPAGVAPILAYDNAPVCKYLDDSCLDNENTMELIRVPYFNSSSNIDDQIAYAARLHCAGLSATACSRAPACTVIEEGSCFILWTITANQTYMMTGKTVNTNLVAV